MKIAAIVLIMGLAITFGQKLMNTLTPEEERDGYELLFDGKSLDKWKSYKVDGTKESWKIVKEGDHTVIRVVAGDRGDIFTKNATYQNFDLKVEWLVPVKGNSGIFIRYLENAGDSWAGHTGPEAQVVERTHNDGIRPLHQAGTCYDMFPLDKGMENWFNPANEWNEFRIIAYENRVAHYGNGKKLLEYEFGSDAFNKAYNASKYNKKPLYKEIHPGSIYLQHHGELGIQYRNLRIKKLGEGEDPWADGSTYREGEGLKKAMTFAENIHPKKPEKPGCPNPAFQEFDSTRTRDDPAMCLTPNTSHAPFFSQLDRPIRIRQFSDRLSIVFPFEAEFSASLVNPSGRLIQSLPRAKRVTADFNTGGISSGLYIINIGRGTQSIQRRVFIYANHSRRTHG